MRRQKHGAMAAAQHAVIFFEQMGLPRPLFDYFQSFQTNQCEKYQVHPVQCTRI